ncbi:hypothetical protein AZE42_12234 [Rhizopogon vesiculosus]|uniref:Uncharacterized protein n=1 Tax=Rhizopogon vesiculosus TaxID=180088 RepID=A0A1J8QLG3_9AGAM|nr:hypothetical protein AZE42_12234 [Rhizopogon vesiculosus]
MQSSPVLIAHSQTQSVNITEVSLIVPIFIQQVHILRRPLVHCVRIQVNYSYTTPSSYAARSRGPRGA